MTIAIETNPTQTERNPVWSYFRLVFGDVKSAIGLVIFLIFAVVAIFAPMIAPYSPTATNFPTLQAPTWTHPMGTTSLGQDVFSQFVYGTRTTLVVGIGAGLISTLLGLIVGMITGYRRGIADSLLNLLTNVFLVLPGLALLIVIESLLKESSPLFNGLIIGLTGWAWGARVFRAWTMSLMQRDFIIAAKLSQASSMRILLTEIAPNMVSVIATNIMYACLGGILAESGLAYLGFESIQNVTWGTMLFWATGNSAIISGAWWWFVPPGLGIAFVGLSLVLMNFGVDRITNPRLRTAIRGRKKRG